LCSNGDGPPVKGLGTRRLVTRRAAACLPSPATRPGGHPAHGHLIDLKSFPRLGTGPNPRFSLCLLGMSHQNRQRYSTARPGEPVWRWMSKGSQPPATAYSAGLCNGTVCGSILARIAPAYGLGQAGWTLAMRTGLDSTGEGHGLERRHGRLHPLLGPSSFVWRCIRVTCGQPTKPLHRLGRDLAVRMGPIFP
jgi:hypothetical protein